MSNDLLTRLIDFYRAFLFLKEQIYQDGNSQAEFSIVNALHQSNLDEMYHRLDVILKTTVSDMVMDTDALTLTLIAEQISRAE